MLGDLYRIQGCPFQDVIGDNPEVDASVDGLILANTADQGFEFAGAISGQRIDTFFRGINKFDSGSISQQRFDFLSAYFLFSLNIYRLRMAEVDRYPDCSGCYSNGGILKDLSGFIDHFHFFFGIAVFKKAIDLG